MKVFMYYLDGELYAFTTNKGLRDKFEKERSMKVLHKKEKKMDRVELGEFMNTYKNKMLVSSPYETVHNVIVNLVVTYEEDEKFSNHIDKLYTLSEGLERKITNFQFNKNIEKKFLEMIAISNKDRDSLNIDCFELFFQLFKHTFLKNENPNDI